MLYGGGELDEERLCITRGAIPIANGAVSGRRDAFAGDPADPGRPFGSASQEDYVDLIADLIADGGEARQVDIAARLGVAQPTVAKALRRLIAEGLVVQNQCAACS